MTKEKFNELMSTMKQNIIEKTIEGFEKHYSYADEYINRCINIRANEGKFYVVLKFTDIFNEVDLKEVNINMLFNVLKYRQYFVTMNSSGEYIYISWESFIDKKFIEYALNKQINKGANIHD